MYTLDVAPPRIPVAMKVWKHHLAFKELDLIIPFPFMARGRQNQLPMKLQPTKLVKNSNFEHPKVKWLGILLEKQTQINPAKPQKKQPEEWWFREKHLANVFLGAPNVFVVPAPPRETGAQKSFLKHDYPP